VGWGGSYDQNRQAWPSRLVCRAAQGRSGMTCVQSSSRMHSLHLPIASSRRQKLQLMEFRRLKHDQQLAAPCRRCACVLDSPRRL
jgi:hypothetical protein